MPYYRTRAYRNRRPYLRPTMPSRSKYSIEQRSFHSTFDSTAVNSLYQARVELVAPTTIQGMRKVKHITLSLTSTAFSTGALDIDNVYPIYWAIVYVPQGTTIGALNFNNSLYEPNQYVMNCGIVDPSAGPIRFSSPISRNLNSGDSVYLVIGTPNGQNVPVIDGVVKYALTLN